MQPAEYTELRNDIASNGLIDPIWLYQSQILDGSNRYKAVRRIKCRAD
ncbi:conserved hypothetical protein [Candidatus Methylobacter favarea]|uniref:ParB/Sulfiredoxin domain-containing protein n=1 Tax=Candidatus Methylobacter favarea TaxID=2707345 RepID=A0A8S0XRW7_9GAMM|nr:conserved hypothetical protein [Candidatus Methylobacter favarea]